MKKVFLLLGLITACFVSLGVLPGSVAVADDPFCDSSASNEAKKAAGCLVNKGTVENKVTEVINIFLYVVGVVAVIMIIYGGFLFMTSAGDAGKVQKAKNAILYSVIGLAIVVLAYAIVNFVIGKVS